MIGEIKGMIAGCIEQMRAQSCGTCERRADCMFVWPEAIGAVFAPRGPATGGKRPGLFVMLYNEIAKAARKHGQRPTSPLRRDVECHLEPLLAFSAPRIDRVAGAMGCSRQTLYRRLKAEGLTFEQILEDLRHRRAVKLLRDPALSVKEIGYRLGFSDPAAFSRAFKRWTGKSPAVLRAQSG